MCSLSRPAIIAKSRLRGSSPGQPFGKAIEALGCASLSPRLHFFIAIFDGLETLGNSEFGFAVVLLEIHCDEFFRARVGFHVEALREYQPLRWHNFSIYTPLNGYSLPSGPRLRKRYAPPTRRSISHTGSVKPRGPHQLARCSGLTNASKTSSRVA
jgi:hypothetical protein